MNYDLVCLVLVTGMMVHNHKRSQLQQNFFSKVATPQLEKHHHFCYFHFLKLRLPP